MFVCCHPALPKDAQVVLALKVLCGFSTAEIARAFLSTEPAIEKQLTRTKQRIRDSNIGFEIPAGPELPERIEAVLAALYLLFNEGYKASTGEHLLREELCLEAVRLLSLLVAHPAVQTSRSQALLALMLLTAARFPTRLDEHGELLRLDDQDRSRRDQALIARGLFHLVAAGQGTDVSEYHLQAGIAACHCTAKDHVSTDWTRILRYYDQLQQLKASPVVALNRAVAIAHVSGPRAALAAIAEMPRGSGSNRTIFITPWWANSTGGWRTIGPPRNRSGGLCNWPWLARSNSTWPSDWNGSRKDPPARKSCGWPTKRTSRPRAPWSLRRHASRG